MAKPKKVKNHRLVQGRKDDPTKQTGFCHWELHRGERVLVWTNFVAGVFRGLGAIIGASLVIAALVWALTLFADWPLIGEYADNIKNAVTQYVRDTNYNDEFDRLGDTLERIEQELRNDQQNNKQGGSGN